MSHPHQSNYLTLQWTTKTLMLATEYPYKDTRPLAMEEIESLHQALDDSHE